MNDPQAEGHMASYIRRREFLATLLGGAGRPGYACARATRSLAAVIADGKLIGAIGVSGATSVQDGQVAKAGADVAK